MDKLEELRAVLGDDSELSKRLQLVAPVLAAALKGRTPSKLQVAKRNTASHVFDISADILAGSSQTELNSIQRRSKAVDHAPVRGEL